MPILPTDLVVVERGGTLFKGVASELSVSRPSPSVAGFYKSCSYGNGTRATFALAASHNIFLGVYMPDYTHNINQLGFAVTTAGATTAKAVIYEVVGTNAVLVCETAALSCSTTGYKFETKAFTFSSQKTYLYAVINMSTAAATLQAVAIADTYPLLQASNSVTPITSYSLSRANYNSSTSTIALNATNLTTSSGNVPTPIFMIA
jgi:hypothetical protein